MSIADAVDGLYAALRGVKGLRVYEDRGAAIDPPAALVGAPTLVWEGPCPKPTSATLSVVIVVSADERAERRLWELLPGVTAAIDALDYASVSRAVPGLFGEGGTGLPCYEIETEVSL